jgi:hypothetical protein
MLVPRKKIVRAQMLSNTRKSSVIYSLKCWILSLKSMLKGIKEIMRHEL